MLGVRETSDLIERIRNTVREFAHEEATLEQAWQNRSSAARKSFDTAQFDRNAQFQARKEKAEAAANAARQEREARAQTRQARIAQAFKSSRKRVLDKIEREEDRHKYLFQKRTLD